MLKIKNDILDEPDEPTALSKTVYYCVNCDTELPEENKFVTKRIPNPYLTEAMMEFNKRCNPGKAHLVNEVDEKVIIICPKCGTRNKIHDYRWY